MESPRREQRRSSASSLVPSMERHRLAGADVGVSNLGVSLAAAGVPGNVTPVQSWS